MHALTLRKIARETLAFYRQLGSRKMPLFVDCLGAEWEFQLHAGCSSRSGLLQIEADWGGAKIFLRADESWVSQIVANVLQLSYPAELPNPVRQIVLEAAFASAAGVLEEATRKRFSVLSATVAELPSLKLTGFQLMLDDGKFATEGELWVDALGLGFLANAMRDADAWPMEIRNFYQLPMPIRFSVGWTDLSLETLEGLKKHDVILLDECWLGDEDDITVRVGKGSGIRGKLSGTTITLTQGLEAIMHDEEQEEMEDENLLDDMSIRVSFDLGERTLTLADLRLLGPGYVFELGRDLRRAVTIRANGKAIGEGELVDIEGQTGVSVLSISSKSE